MNKGCGFLWLNDSILLVGIGVVIFNNWIWKIASKDILVASLLAALAILFLLILKKNNYRNFIVTALIALFILIGSIVLVNNFDGTLNNGTTEELKQMGERHGYLAEGMGKLYLNKFSLVFYKNYGLFFYHLEKNIFRSIDLNQYFFAGHPRERVETAEFEKFPFFYFPFFVIGLLNVLKKGSATILIYFIPALAINIFLTSAFILGPVLFFPLIVALIALGIDISWVFIKK